MPLMHLRTLKILELKHLSITLLIRQGTVHKLCQPKMGGPDPPSPLCQPLSAFSQPPLPHSSANVSISQTPLPPLSAMSAFAQPPLPVLRQFCEHI